jgi:hypothetical protein
MCANTVTPFSLQLQNMTTDTIFVSVNAMYNTNLWGAQVTATADVDQEVVTPPWIVDLHRSVRPSHSSACSSVDLTLCISRCCCVSLMAHRACQLVISYSLRVCSHTATTATPPAHNVSLPCRSPTCARSWLGH